LIKLIENIDKPLQVTWLHSGGQRSRSQLAIKVNSCERHISGTTWAFSM